MGVFEKLFMRKIVFEHVSGKDYQYSLLGRTVVSPAITFDNEKRTIRTEDFTEDNKYSVEFEIVYNGREWLVRGVTNIAKFDN